jgi:protein gp37
MIVMPENFITKGIKPTWKGKNSRCNMQNHLMRSRYSKPGLTIATFYRPEHMTIFVGSMTDIFSEGVAPMNIHILIQTMEKHKQHTFMLLTKKPENYIKYSWPQNCMLGTTVELISEKTVQRMYDLMENPNDQFLSIEPILGSFESVDLSFPDLIIIGADKKPEKFWIESVIHPNIWYKKNLRKFYPEFKNKES